MVRSAESKRPVKIFLAASLASFFLLMFSCKTRSHNSQIKSSDAAQTGIKKLINQGKGSYRVIFQDENKILANTPGIALKWRVVSGWSREPVDCKQILMPAERSQVLLENDEVSMSIQINPKEFTQCQSNSTVRQEYRKLSLDCQKSGKWDGARLLEACLVDKNDKVLASGRQVPEKAEHPQGMNLQDRLIHTDDVINYGKVCAERLGPLPRDWSCLDGPTIPITSDGKEIPFGEHKPGQKCDKTIYLGLGEQGQCVPYARLLRLYTKRDVETVAICRRYKMGTVGPDQTITQAIDPALPLVQDVAIVQHNIKTGETCFFQGLSGFREDNRDLPVARVPPPDEETLPADIVAKYAHLPAEQQPVAAKDFWIRPSDPGENPSEPNFQCIICHDSDPFMHSPYVDQLNFDYKFNPVAANLFGGPRSRDNLVNPGLGPHPFEGRQDKMVPCDPGAKGPIKNGEVPQQLCVFNKAEGVNEAKGKYSLVHEVHQRTFPKTWNVIPKLANGELDDTCTKCHRIGSISTCRAWAPDSTGIRSVASNTQRTQYGKSFPFSHWMPVVQADDFLASTPRCLPDVNNPQRSANCDFGLQEWKQRFEAAALRLDECCNLSKDFTNKDPNMSESFAAKCQAFPISSAPPGTNGSLGSISWQGGSISIGNNGKESIAVFLKGENFLPNSKLNHILVHFSLTHKSPGDISVSLQHNVRTVEIFNGQKDLIHPNKAVTDFKLSI
ncbi:MAG: hypothetical protein NTX25_08185, partial [Proteobacteria bacterium]|nr:hypothetical protein [Pseudomonadota bacterium]